MPITPEIACKHLISAPIAVKARQPAAHENWRSWKRQWQQDRRAALIILRARTGRVAHAGLCADVTPTRAHVCTGGMRGLKGATRRNHRWLPFITPRSKHGPESGPLGWLTRNDDSPAVRDAALGRAAATSSRVWSRRIRQNRPGTREPLVRPAITRPIASRKRPLPRGAR